MFNADRYKNWITVDWKDHLISEKDMALKDGNKDIANGISASLENTVVVSRDDLLPGRVQFASQVTVFSVDEEEEQSFQIVSESEAEYTPGKISIYAPLAKALIGAREGDVVDVELENKAHCSYEVTHIHLPLR